VCRDARRLWNRRARVGFVRRVQHQLGFAISLDSVT
jgi:hypothetical protein